MRFVRLAKKNGKLNELYESEVVNRIRKRYSVDQEFAIHRKRDTEPAEFEEYNAFVEDCKSAVKKEMGI